MQRTALRTWSVTAGLVVLVVVIVGFLVERAITGTAFDRLESAQAAQDAQRIRIALDDEVRILTNYGATNSVWTDAYEAVRDGDPAAFAAAFPPDEIHEMYGLDAVLGLGTDGTLRVGGLAGKSSSFSPVPGDLARPALLRSLFTPTAKPGAGRCGVVSSTAAPFLYCGFAAYDTDESRAPSGGLVYLAALDADGVAALGSRVDLPVSLANHEPAGSQAQPAIASSLGSIRVSTATAGSRISVSAAVKTINGGTLRIKATQSRPIHAMADRTALATLALMLGTGVLLLVVVLLLVQRGIRRQIHPLASTVRAVINSGDRDLRVGLTGTGDIPALGEAIDQMLDSLAAKNVELEREHAAREAEMADMVGEVREAEQRALGQARRVLDETSALVVGPLADVAEQVGAVRVAADDIDHQVEEADQATRRAVEQARAVDSVMSALGESLHRVEGIAKLIGGLAGQTNLLALNATIEAARAGEAGRGFSVVASEVKNLATSTAESTGEITSIIGTLQHDASAVAATLAGVSEGIGGIDEATSAIRAVAVRQRDTVARLDGQVGEALTRARAMAER